MLPGVVRDSIIQLTKETFKEISVEERPFKITELLERHSKGQIEEVFCSGTAAVVSPVDVLTIRGVDINLDTQKKDSFSRKIKSIIEAIQRGHIEHPFSVKI